MKSVIFFIVCSFIIFFLLSINFSIAEATSITHGPVVGQVSDTTVSIWLRTGQAGQAKVLYKKTSESSWYVSGSVTTDSGADYTALIKLTNLKANSAYDYKIQVDDTDQANATSTFTTLPAAGTASTFSFAFGADIYYPLTPHTIFDKILDKNPSFMLLVGDQMYADVGTSSVTLDDYRTRYRENWGESHFATFMKQVPTFFMWDDHEIQNDWSSGKTSLYIPARQAAEEYQFKANPTPRVAGELYYTFGVGEADFYVMDTRTFRSANNETDNSSKTMLGTEQKADLKRWLSSSQAKFKFLVSSVPFDDFATTPSDAWEAFTTERKEIFDYISDNNIEGVIFLTGDQHFSLIAKFTDIAPKYNLFEFLPTPLNITMRVEPSSSDSQILFKQDDIQNYGFFSVDTTVSPAKIIFTNYDTSNNSLYALTITERDINQNTGPRVTIQEGVPGAISGDWQFKYTLEDADGDSCTIRAEYSTDDIHWSAATITSTSAGTPGVKTATWQTKTDLPNVDKDTVYFKIRANDEKRDGPWRYIGDTFASPGSVFKVKNTRPTVSKLSPADNSINVSLTTNLAVTFTRPVTIESGEITIFNKKNNTVFERIKLPSQLAQVKGSNTDTITIKPLLPFIKNTEYYVQIAADTFRDLNNNNFAGINDTTTWSFKTADSYREITLQPTTTPVTTSKDLLVTSSNTKETNIFFKFIDKINYVIDFIKAILIKILHIFF